MSAQAKRALWLRPEEYLMMERQAEYRSEYFDGDTFAMAGASRRHNVIVSNIVRILGNQLLDRRCNVYASDMRVKIEKIRKYTYPDVVVACDDERFEDDMRDSLLNPIVIFEVLSDSTEAYDQGEKFTHYQAIDSLVEYILVSQSPYSVEQFVKQNTRIWTYYKFDQENDVLPLQAIHCEIILEDMYKKVLQKNRTHVPPKRATPKLQTKR